MNCHRIILASLVMVMVVQKISAGPASTLALTIQARTAKIPRTIRTPYENTGIMTARGFGKRSESLRLIDCKLIKLGVDINTNLLPTHC